MTRPLDRRRERCDDIANSAEVESDMQARKDDPRPRLRLFGAFAYAAADGRERPVSSRRGRAILAYAALQRDHTAARSRLAGLLWSDRGEAQARASLRQCFVELNHALGDEPLEIGRESIRFRSEAVTTDVHELQAALDGEDVDRLCVALARIGADILLDEPAMSDLHQDWIDQTRDQLERRIAGEVHAVLESHIDGDWQIVRGLAEAFLARQPLDEIAVCAAMRADTALGTPAAAVLRFNVLKSGLAREIGVAPGEAVQLALKQAVAPCASAALDAEPRPAVTMQLLASSPPTVLVAAFQSPDPSGLADAIREEIVAGLSRFRDLSLIADGRPEAEIRRDAWLRRDDAYLLSAGLFGANDGDRLVTRLTRMSDFGQIWSDRAEIAHDDAGSAVERIVTRVVGAMLPTIDADLSPRLATAPPGVYGRYILARNAASRAATFAEAQSAAEALERLIAAEPDLSQPCLPLARLYNTDFGFTRAHSSTPALRDRAFDLAKRALALDRGNVHGYTVTGWCYLWRGRWDAAQQHFDLAIEMNPFHAGRLMEVGFGLLFLGDFPRARQLLDRCLLLNPVPKDGFFMDLGLLELLEGRHERAEDHFDMVAAPTIFDTLYSAINAALGGAPAPDRSRAARARIEAIWPEGARPGVEAMCAWFAHQHPFRSPDITRRLVDGLRMALNAA